MAEQTTWPSPLTNDGPQTNIRAKTKREIVVDIEASLRAAKQDAANDFFDRFRNAPLNKLWNAMDAVYPSPGSHEFWAGKSKSQIALLWVIDPLLARVSLDMIAARLK